MPLAVTADEGRRAEAQARALYDLQLDPAGRESVYGPDAVLLFESRVEVAPQRVDLGDPHESDRRDQVVQHLRDLGFLKEEEHNPDDARLAEALRGFYRESEHFDAHFVLNIERDEDIAPAHSQGDREASLSDASTAQALVIHYRQLRRLMHLTSLDGELLFRTSPHPLRVDLRSRVAHFRLRTYNFVSLAGEDTPEDAMISRPDVPVPDAVWPRLDELRDLLGQPGSGSLEERCLAMLNALASPELLADWLETARDGPVTDAWIRVRKDQHGQRRNFGHMLGRRRFQVLRADASLRSVFALELLQIFLWRDDYYLGEIDLHWGAESRRALKRFADQQPATRRREVLQRTTGRTYEVNALRTIQLLRDQPGSEGDIYDKQDQVLGKLDTALEQEQIADWNQFDRRIHQKNLEQERRQRRRYFGIRAFVRAIRRIAAATVDWLRDVLRRLFGPVLKFLRFLARGMRTAIRIAGMALRYAHLFASGKPLLSGSVSPLRLVVTWHRLDKDMTCFALTAGEPVWVSRHFDLLDSLQQAFVWIVKIALTAGKILAGSISGPMGWFLAARDIFQVVRDIMDAQKTPVLRGSMLWA